MASILIEQCQVAPPPDHSVTELTLPLTYFDHMWFIFSHMRRIQFYKLPISQPDFAQTIIPALKNSLSLALKHYTILAGNVVCPLNSNGYPELHYVTGNSVSVTFSKSDMNFNYLIGNHPRNAKDFYPLVPQTTEAKRPAQARVLIAPLLAIQVTLFPNHGISIGFMHHHVAGDGASLAGFAKAWALLNKFGGNEQFFADHGLVPVYDRSLIKDPYGQGMSIWDDMKHKLDMSGIIVTPLDKVRSTFIMGGEDIVKLKKLILSRRPKLTHVTSFTVTCAYIWTCLIKSETAINREEIDENTLEIFGCVADCRSRLNPPIPQSYFGNCLVTLITKASRIDLVGKEGFTIAAELIGETIQKQMKDEELILNCDWYREFCAIDLDRTLAVAGSTKFNLYNIDFGWGRPDKIEFISIDSARGVSMSLSKCKDSDGDLEVGLSLPKTRMSAFAAIFTHGLNFL